MPVMAGTAAGGDLRFVEAVQSGDREALRALLRESADVNAAKVDGSTAMHVAVHRDDRDAVNLLLQAGANVSARARYEVAPLSLASVNGNARAAAEGRGDPNTTWGAGETALLTAARTGRVGAIRTLSAHGEDPNRR